MYTEKRFCGDNRSSEARRCSLAHRMPGLSVLTWQLPVSALKELKYYNYQRNERLINKGCYDLAAAYQSVHVNY